jgi:hypothetical protein
MKKGFWISIGLLAAVGAYGNIGGYCAAVDAEGTNAYLGAGQVLLRIDVSDPSAPACSGSRHLPGRIEDVLVDGTNVYAACGEAGVYRMSTALEQLGAYDSPGHAYGLALAGTSLYLADGVGGLQVLDAPTLSSAGHYATNGPIMDVVAEGAAIYLLDHFNGVIALDAALNETGAYGLVAFGNRMALDGENLFVVDGARNITQLDRFTMTLSTNAPGIPTFGIASGMAIDQGRHYVAAGFGGLAVHDLATEVLLGSYAGVSRSRATAIANGLAYVAAGDSGVKIFDLSDLSNPSCLASVATSNALDVAIANGLLLVADAFQGLEIFDLSLPVAPNHLGTYAPPSPAVVRCVGASGSCVYVGAGYTVRRLDLSDPASPVSSESFMSPNYVYDLDVAGTTAFLATGSVHSVTVEGTQALYDWTLFDLSDPLTPVSITNLAPLVRAMRLTLLDEVAYASADDGGTVLVALPPNSVDSDDDGLDDALEQLIIDFDPDDRFNDLADINPDDDFDGDGLSNLGEQLAGTSPVDPNSVFALCGLDGEVSGHSVSWYSCAGHAYTVHKSTNLVEGFYVLRSGISATEPINTLLDPDSHDCAMYMVTLDP